MGRSGARRSAAGGGSALSDSTGAAEAGTAPFGEGAAVGAGSSRGASAGGQSRSAWRQPEDVPRPCKSKLKSTNETAIPMRFASVRRRGSGAASGSSAARRKRRRGPLGSCSRRDITRRRDRSGFVEQHVVDVVVAMAGVVIRSAAAAFADRVDVPLGGDSLGEAEVNAGITGQRRQQRKPLPRREPGGRLVRLILLHELHAEAA